MNILFVFAHQDDEVAAAIRILRARRNGDRVICAFLTDGAIKVPASIRNEESRAALALLGVTDLLFASFPDGNLPEHAGGALAFLESQVGEVGEVCTLAWEGGHQDHDAAHVIALAFARRRGVPCREVPLYNGRGTPRSFFRVLRPLGEGWATARVHFSEALLVLSLVRFYKSQRKTWCGLLPEAMFELLIARRTHVRDADPRRLNEKPHSGDLFYERRFGYPYERFMRAMSTMIAEV
jgi:LmbE family N-acetylglucosaminyl deacetylase